MARTRSVSLKTKAAAKASAKVSAKVSGKVSAKPGVKGRARISAAEWETRVDLAAAFRIAYHLGWNDKITNHITARVPGQPDHFLMNRRVLGWHEITASNLLKVDFDGNVIGEPGVPLAPAGFNFHSAILKAKPEINCVVHTHTSAALIVSAMKNGLSLIVDQTSCHIHGRVSYHAFEGYASERDEAPRIISDLGRNFVMIMRNHGLLGVGRTIAEAFVYTRRLIDACDLQVKLMSTGAEINTIPDDVLAFTHKQIEARQGDTPYGDGEWRMYRRLAAQLDPKFAK